MLTLPKLHFASGSLRQYLDISYDTKLASSATPPDEIEGALYKFIPPDYTKSKVDFQKRVSDDAEAFKPLGEKIGSYVRPSAGRKGKGQGDTGMAAGKSLEDNEDVVVYEMYKVRMHAVRPSKPITDGSLGDMEYPWIPRISPQNADLHPSFHRRRKLRTCEAHHGYSRISSSLKSVRRKTRTPGNSLSFTNAAKDRILASSPIISLATFLSTHFGVIRTA